MTPAARLAAAASILDTLDWSAPIDPQLRAWARGNRYAGSKDRRAIADRVYAIIRHRRSCMAQGGGASGRAMVLGALVQVDELDVEAVAGLCEGGYGLMPLSGAERAALARAPDFASEGERYDWPDWLLPHAEAAFGEDMAAELEALRSRAPLDLRVNTLKGDREALIALLADEGMSASALPHSPTALRLDIHKTITGIAAYRDGLIELQDAGSQAITDLTEAQPGETVLDYCAGAGGKTLGLAALMQNRGNLIAHDVNATRMAPLRERAERAGATCITMARERAAMAAYVRQCDAVLVDAPCSGSGSWRRDPVGKWRLTPNRLGQLVDSQYNALCEASEYTQPNGRLVYATCSVLCNENEEIISRFLSDIGGFELDKTVRFQASRDQCDGFFGAVLVRNR